jgi:hypothetical protein
MKKDSRAIKGKTPATTAAQPAYLRDVEDVNNDCVGPSSLSNPGTDPTDRRHSAVATVLRRFPEAAYKSLRADRLV